MRKPKSFFHKNYKIKRTRTNRPTALDGVGPQHNPNPHRDGMRKALECATKRIQHLKNNINRVLSKPIK